MTTDWTPETEAPIDKMLILFVKIRIAFGNDATTRIIPAFKKANGKWYETTSVGSYLVRDIPVSYMEFESVRGVTEREGT